MDSGLAQCTFYIPQSPRIVQQLTVTFTPPEQAVYNAVMASHDICHLRVEIQTVASALRYDHDFFNLRVHNYTTYPALVNYSK